jgi:hypothetical protein
MDLKLFGEFYARHWHKLVEFHLKDGTVCKGSVWDLDEDYDPATGGSCNWGFDLNAPEPASCTRVRWENVESFTPLEPAYEGPIYLPKDDLGQSDFVRRHAKERIEIVCKDGTVLRGLVGNVAYTKGQESIFRNFEVNGVKQPSVTVHKSKFTAYAFV